MLKDIHYVLYNEPLTKGKFYESVATDLINFSYPAGHMCFYEITQEDFVMYNIYTLILLPPQLAYIFDANHFEWYRCLN